MEQSVGFNEAVKNILNDMRSYFLHHSKEEIIDYRPPSFSEIAKATIIKSYEFEFSIIKHHEEYMYFTLPSLRGICEEYIVEKFIWSQLNDERDEIIQLRHYYDLLKSSIIQGEYFKANRPNQTVYCQNDFSEKMDNAKNRLRAIVKSKLPGVSIKEVFPSVYFMAKEIGELELYNYLYHASSSFVHFSPHNLLRMGWGNLPNIEFSTKHFKLYYRDFSLFYGLLLLSKLCEWQKSNDFLPGFNEEYCSQMKSILERAERWPELITFEEMNIKIDRNSSGENSVY